jgi:hypothetical protein
MATTARAMVTATKRVMARAARAMATAMKRALTAAARAMVTATKRARVKAARAMATATRVSGKGRRRQRRGPWCRQWQQRRGWRTPKRALATVIAIATSTRVAGNKKGDGTGNKKGDGNGNKEGDGNQQQQHGQLLPRRGWRAFNSGDNGDGAKDTAARATTGERGMMVAMDHVLCVCFCVCGETTKNEEEKNIVMVP